MAKRKKKEKPPNEELTAPFYMLTYGDMMTLLLTFFVLLFSMSTLQVIKFQAQVGAMKGAMGISEMFQHAPMQRTLPAPSVKVNQKITAKAKIQVEPTTNIQDSSQEQVEESTEVIENQEVKTIRSIGQFGEAQISQSENEVILILPTYGIFNEGEYTINVNSSEVKRVTPKFLSLAKELSYLTEYDILFVGHTDSLPINLTTHKDGPKNNIELGFMRATALYDYFFKNIIKDQTRVIFASQGDNVPIIQNAQLDSENRKNRRVEVRLRKKRPRGSKSPNV